MTPAFEQFARSKGWPTWRKPDGKTYIDTRVQFAWTVWEYLAEDEPPSCCEKAAPGTICADCAAASAGYSAAMGPVAAAPQQPASVEGGR